ncbi:MAG: hypothetical protein JWN43_4503 [Gammaproteobacteria bacterium]|nr:hypothetical protein [Gammaproteobacteria bacterium]
MTDPHLSQLIRLIVGDKATEDLLGTLYVDRVFLLESAGAVSRGVFAMALNAILFHDLLSRVPTAAAYVADRRRQRERIIFDHGALRTVRFGSSTTGELPAGFEAFSRILEPLGYDRAGTYPLAKLHMTGHAFAHREFPETLPQFFVSELHIDRFSHEFQAAAERVFSTSRDPLTATTHAALAEFAEQGRCEMKLAAPALREIVAAFGRWHDAPALSDYRILLAESAEGAWIASEGSAFNHATDRVADVAMTACAQRSLGRPLKAAIETSASGTVRQTAFKADPVLRSFRADDGTDIAVTVPGSFYEFISRDKVTGADGKKRLDLRFDDGNAQGIFKMTAAG